MSKSLSITVTIRKISSGYKVTAFAGENQDHLYSICKVLMKSPEYARCYCVALDWQGEPLFEVRPEEASPAPYQMPQRAPQLPQQTDYGYQHPTPPPQQYHHAQLPQQAYYPPVQQHYAAPPPQYARSTVATHEGVIESNGGYSVRALPAHRR
jgi:hypothetical protein